jgi:hypothetical protein
MEMEQVYSIMLSDITSYSNWFNAGRSTENIIEWRTFRRSITKDHIHAVANAWQQCPTIDSYLEFDDPRNWPDPWTLISDGIYDDTARALGIFYTLYFTSYEKKDNMFIEVYRDRKNHEYLNLVRCEDGLYTLNYREGQVVNNLHISLSAELITTVTPKQLHI